MVTKESEGSLCGTGSLRVRLDYSIADPFYVSLYLSTQGIRDHLLLECVGSTMDNLNTGILARIPVVVPPKHEQDAIGESVAIKTKRIRKTTEAIVQSIEMLREYRTALISASVTGKIDVSDA